MQLAPLRRRDNILPDFDAHQRSSRLFVHRPLVKTQGVVTLLWRSSDLRTFAFFRVSRFSFCTMRTFTLIGLAAGFVSGVSAACSSALKIDDFSKWSSNTNSLGQWTSGKMFGAEFT